MKTQWLLAVVMSSLFSLSVRASAVTVDFEPGQTAIQWVLVGNVHTVHGTFKLEHGHITVDPQSGALGGELVADAASGDSGNETRDKRMNKDVLQSDRFPEVKLLPRKLARAVTLTGHSNVEVSGTFIVHGESHEISVPLDIAIAGNAVTVKGKFSVPYVEWGMKNPSNLFFKVERSVEIEVRAVGHMVDGAKP
jgi:polyisoprenoid-binding protein YceI